LCLGTPCLFDSLAAWFLLEDFTAPPSRLLFLHTGGVVLDDIPRTALDRKQDQDKQGVQAAARSAAAAKQKMSQVG